MNYKLAISVLIMAVLVNSFVIAMEEYISELLVASSTDKKISVLAIPGINGFGDDATDAIKYVKAIIGDNINIIPVKTPSPITADLGQNNCIRHLREAVAKNPGKHVLYCMSQGTATALNYLATEDKGNIAALIMEAALASGNSAIIHHSANGSDIILKLLANAPGSYYWMTYGAKFKLPCYWPSGKQPINLVKDMKKVPIIIVHAKGDPKLSYQSALALYYGLREKDYPAYFISKEGKGHIGIVKDDISKKIIRTILKENGFSTDLNAENVDVSQAQPDHKQFAKEYNELISKERNHVILGYTLKVGAAALLAGSAYYAYNKFFSKSTYEIYNKFIPKSYTQGLSSRLYNRLFSK